MEWAHFQPGQPFINAPEKNMHREQIYFDPSVTIAKPKTAQEAVKVVFVRHGESIWNKAGKFTGWIDVPLNDLGRK